MPAGWRSSFAIRGNFGTKCGFLFFRFDIIHQLCRRHFKRFGQLEKCKQGNIGFTAFYLTDIAVINTTLVGQAAEAIAFTLPDPFQIFPKFF